MTRIFESFRTPGTAAFAVFLAAAVPAGPGPQGPSAKAPAAQGPIAQTRSATDVGAQTAILQGAVKPKKVPASYWFEYGTSEEYGLQTVAATVEGKKRVRVSAPVSQLSPETVYHFRLVARSGAKTSKGRDLTFTTLSREKGEEEGEEEEGEEGEEEGGTGKWSLQEVPSGGTFGNTLESVSCLSATECVAVGEAGGPFAISWDGTSWSSMPTPPAPAEINSVSCTSFTACTAVGHTETETLALRLEGGEWEVQDSPNAPGATRSQLFGVSCTSPTFCLAVGRYQSGGGWYPLAEVWDGSEWKLQEMPAPFGSWVTYMYDVSCISTIACMAVGYSPTGAVVERWDGVKWEALATPPGGTGLNSVSCVSASSCVAVGHTVSIDDTYAIGWDGSEWGALNSLDPQGSVRAELTGVSCVSPGSCTAVGWYEADAGTGTAYPLAEAWDGSKWEIQPTPMPPESVSAVLQDVSCVLSPALTCEAVGRYNAGPIRGFALRYE